MKKQSIFFGLAAIVATSLFTVSVRGDAFVYYYTEVFSGTAPSGPAPWADALFEDVSAGTVRLTICNVGLTNSENQKEFYFNLDPSLDPTSLTFLHTGGIGAFDMPTISTGVNAFMADGDGNYDIKFLFTPGGVESKVFGAGEEVVYEISGIGSLTVNDFIFLSSPAGGHGPFFSAAHVQNTGGGGDSAWIAPLEAAAAVPEPTTYALFGLGCVSLMAALRRKTS